MCSTLPGICITLPGACSTLACEEKALLKPGSSIRSREFREMNTIVVSYLFT